MCCRAETLWCIPASKLTKMKTAIFVIMTLVKLAAISYFVVKILKTLLKKNDPTSKQKAFIQFLYLFGVILGLTLLDFGIAFLVPPDS